MLIHHHLKSPQMAQIQDPILRLNVAPECTPATYIEVGAQNSGRYTTHKNC